MDADRIGVERQDRAVAGNHGSLGDQANGAPDDLRWIVEHGTRPGSRYQSAIRFIRAVREHLGSYAETSRTTRIEQSRFRQAEQHQPAVEGRGGAGNGLGERGVARGHVEQRAMGFHVLKGDAFGGRDTGDSRNLVQDEILGFPGRDAKFPPPKTREIGKARMRADSDAMLPGEPDRLTEY
jgi:hypothetical protein